MTPALYHLHDWSISSEIPLAATQLPDQATPLDLRVVRGARRPIPNMPPAGVPLALDDEPQGVALCQSAAGHTLRFFGLCDFEFDGPARRLTVHVAPDAAAETAELMLTSSALSFLLELHGHCVLHASAVVLRDRAIAFMGPAGCGKSSLAAAFCALGAPLLSDDVLRCEVSQGVRCNRGTFALRLRENQRDLAQLFSTSTRSIDDRIVVRATPAASRSYRVAALLAPAPAPHLQLTRISGVDAIAGVLSAARVTSWRSQERRVQQFSALAALGSQVPVFRLALPQTLLHTGQGRRELYETVEQLLHDGGA